MRIREIRIYDILVPFGETAYKMGDRTSVSSITGTILAVETDVARFNDIGCLVISVANQCIGAGDRRTSGNFARRVRKLVQRWDLTERGFSFNLRYANPNY
jgi:hypothetical protein